jgi:hypothetical protein
MVEKMALPTHQYIRCALPSNLVSYFNSTQGGLCCHSFYPFNLAAHTFKYCSCEWPVIIFFKRYDDGFFTEILGRWIYKLIT